MTLLVIDTETTNTDPKTGRIIQLAAQLYKNGKLEQEFNEKIRQDPQESKFNVDLGALKVNKTKLSQLKCNTNPEWKVTEMFVDWLLSINQQYKNIELVGHRLDFDLQFITEMCSRNGVNGLNSVLPYRYYDTCAIGMFLNSVGVLNIEKFNSENLFKALSVSVKKEDLHDALRDCEATFEAFVNMQKLLTNLMLNVVNLHNSSYQDLVNLTQDPLAVKSTSTPEFQSLTTEPVMPLKEMVNG